MVSELEYSRLKTKQTEKVSAWQEIAQRMAHEIKNPLTPIKLSAQRLLRKYENADSNFEHVLRNSIDSIIREVENLNTMLQEFRDFARLPLPEPETINLAELVREVIATYSAPHQRIEFDITDINEKIEIKADRKQLYHVFTNLFKNAIDSITEKGKIYLRADLVTKGNLRYCRIQIQDTGSGIEPEQYDQVFNPYFTTKKDGTGLGLPIVERIIFDHNGQVWFESEKGVGTTFFIDVPVEGP
jgi:nitrogen fixation/metabolism regulation signal transduction histidine kinase